jgi:hypothetical protein
MIEFPLWLPKNEYSFALRLGTVCAKAAAALTGGFAQIEEEAVMGGEQKKRPPASPAWIQSKSGKPEGRGAAITRKWVVQHCRPRRMIPPLRTLL